MSFTTSHTNKIDTKQTRLLNWLYQDSIVRHRFQLHTVETSRQSARPNRTSNIPRWCPRDILIRKRALRKLFFHAKRNAPRCDKRTAAHFSSCPPNKGVPDRISRRLFSVLFLFMRPEEMRCFMKLFFRNISQP